MELTRQQIAAIRYAGRNLQLIACAGSGKTEVVARRVAHLLTRRQRRLQPRNVAAFTFTNKAAAELKDRIFRRTSEVQRDAATGMADMYVGTIHGFCQELLNTEVPKYLKFEPLDAVRQKLYIDRKSRQTGLTQCTRLTGRRGKLRRYVDTERYSAALSALREDNVQTTRLRRCSVYNLGLPAYHQTLDTDGYLDFSAMLELAVTELEHNANLRERLAERLKCIVVDEYQDVNPVQERLINMLHDLGAGLCVVGDDDQTIYQWRGSSVGNILTFEHRYPDVKQIRLEHNYRSSQGVIETARTFAEGVQDRLPKSMKYGDAQKHEPGDIVALAFDDPSAEATYIAKTAKSLRGVRFSEGAVARGLAWSDMAVLLRSVRRNGDPIAAAFKEAGIPFVVSGIANLFDTAEAEAARQLFHYIAGNTVGSGDHRVKPPSRRALRNHWKQAELGVQSTFLTTALKYADSIHAGLREGSVNSPSIQAVYLRFLELIHLREEDVPDARGQAVLFNLGRFSEVITDWESIHFADQTPSFYEGFSAFLYYDGDDTYSEGGQDRSYVTPDAVQIMTVHQAKGREWPVVFLPALLKNRFPCRMVPSQIWQLLPREAFLGADRYDASNDDERRLFYVAMTRSKKFLHMTWAPVPGNRMAKSKSAFWDEVLASTWVERQQPSYRGRLRASPKPRVSVADVEFTFSELKYMFECPYQFKLRVLYGFNAPIERPLGYGKSLHDALAEVHYCAMRNEPVTVSQVPGLVERHLRTPYAFGELKQRLEAAARRDIAKYIRDNEHRFHEIEFSEQTVEVNLGNGVSIKGRIDLVRQTDTGKVTIVDLKSNERAQSEHITKYQLHTYALGYEALTGRDADFVEIYELDKGNAKRTPVNDHFVSDVRKRTRRAASDLRRMRLTPKPSRTKCTECDLSSLCGASRA